MDGSNKTVELAALGRPFSLGMLYDCRQDTLIPGLTLWDYEDLEKDTRKRHKPNTEFEIVASESIEDKTSSLNVEAELKASFLGGLVKVDGSAKYLNDDRISKNQARVTFKYKATTEFQELSMSHLGRGNVKHPHVFDSGVATHVVTGILYGAQAFFVFDRQISDKENRQEIEGNLKAAINKIPCISIEGQASLQMEDTDIAKVDQFSCKFHGDFALDTTPVSFKDAMQVYQSLPHLLGTNGENAVPVKVWLLPLTVIDSTAAQIVREISIGLVKEAQSFLEDFSELELRCNDAIKSPAAQQFPKATKNLKAFKELCNEYKLVFQKTLAKKLPSIRGGGEEESVLAEILKRRHSSPFNNKHLNEWLDWKESSLTTISFLTNLMKVNSTIVSSQNDLANIILSSESQHAVCFAFTSLQQAEPYLTALSGYLRETPKQPNTQDAVLHDVGQPPKEETETLRQKAKLFIDFSEANKDNKDIQFLTTISNNDQQPGASICIYNNWQRVNENFEPPSKPETPAVSGITHNSVTLKICPPRFGADISHYSIEYCVTGQEVWEQHITPKADEVTISNLTPNTEYKFRYRAVCPIGRGPASEISGSVKTLPTSPPENLKIEAHLKELSVNWEKPTELGDGVIVESYTVEYAQVSTKMKHEQLQWKKVMSNAERAIIPKLEPLTKYVVRVRCECGAAGRSKESIAVTVQTKMVETIRLAEFYRRESKEVKNSKHPPMFQLMLKENEMDVYGCKSYSFGKESMRRSRTIMVLGAIGTGKSTLINGMINYILGVNWNDDYRFRLINEEPKSQAKNQTSEVIAYKINHQEGFEVPYSLTIIDTPGFGDTRGISRDKAITEQIRSLFSSQMGVSEIDAVCFVTQASLVRLTQPQKYVFDSVLSIFGKDIAENIRMLVTFADGQQPPVLEAINKSNVPCPKTERGIPIHFKFNNSALFADNRLVSNDDEDEENFEQMFWNMGMRSMKHFFAGLDRMETKSLLLTKEVLKERKMLEAAVEGLQPQVKAGIAKLEEIKMNKQKVQKHEVAISQNENFEFEVELIKPIQQKLTKPGEFITNCQQCSMACHYPCLISNDNGLRACPVMNSSGYCTVCPGRCSWNVHLNQKYRWEYVKVKEMRTVQDLKEKYEKATKEKIQVQDLIKQQEEEIADIQDVIISLVEKSASCLARLNDIALRPNPISAPGYIDLLIEGEKSEAKAGYLTRIRSLEAMREQANFIDKVAKDEKLLPAETAIYAKTQRQKKSGVLKTLLNSFKGKD